VRKAAATPVTAPRANSRLGCGPPALGGETRGVLLAPADLRRYLWRLASTVAPGVGVLAYQELPPDAEVRPVGRIAIEGLDPLSLGAGAH